MKEVITVGIDIAKNVFQIHGVDAQGVVVLRRKLRRSEMSKLFERLPPCLIGIEACATAHHSARHLMTLGHEVKLMPAAIKGRTHACHRPPCQNALVANFSASVKRRKSFPSVAERAVCLV